MSPEKLTTLIARLDRIEAALQSLVGRQPGGLSGRVVVPHGLLRLAEFTVREEHRHARLLHDVRQEVPWPMNSSMTRRPSIGSSTGHGNEVLRSSLGEPEWNS